MYNVNVVAVPFFVDAYAVSAELLQKDRGEFLDKGLHNDPELLAVDVFVAAVPVFLAAVDVVVAAVDVLAAVAGSYVVGCELSASNLV